MIRDRLHAISPYENFSVAGEKLDLQGWHSTDPVFARLINEVRPGRIIEVGSWKGASAIGMAGLAKQHGLDTEILCIDTWLGALEFWTAHDDPTRYGSLKLRHGFPSVYYTFLTNVVLSGHADVITPFPQTSLTGARWLSLQAIQGDLIYIDGSHEEADVIADIAAFWPALRPGGVMFGDDFSPAWPSVVRGVRAVAKRLGLTVEEDNEFWIIRKPADASAREPVPLAPATAVERPLLLVYAEERSRAQLARFVAQLGYAFVAPGAWESAPRGGSAIWITPGQSFPIEAAKARFGEVQSLFWLEHEQGPDPAWLARWRDSFVAAGGASQVVTLHPHRCLVAQRERCELLCRRLGVDLTALRLIDDSVPRSEAPMRPDPAGPHFAAELELLNSMGVGPHEFLTFPALQPIALKPDEFRIENPGGGSFEAYSPSHFLLHPPEPRAGWTRLYIRDVDWQNCRYFAVTLSLPSARAPAIRFQWNIVSTEDRRLGAAEVVLHPLENKQWVVPLPAGVPAGSYIVLATRVESAPTNAFSWATWRDPILFS